MRHPTQDRVIPSYTGGNKGRSIALPLLVLSAGLMLAQPCAAAPFAFRYTGSLSTARSGYTATLLQNGKVLVAGGQDPAAFWQLQNFMIQRPANGPRPGVSIRGADFTPPPCCPTAKFSSLPASTITQTAMVAFCGFSMRPARSSRRRKSGKIRSRPARSADCPGRSKACDCGLNAALTSGDIEIQ
jgi:hypothetical protein